MIKSIIFSIFSFIVGFGFWYLIFWFLTTEPNLFMWHMVTKIVYLIFSIAATQGIIDSILNENN
jgi:hypothetical protein